MTPPFKPLPDHLDHPAGSGGALAQIAASQVGYREGAGNDNAFGVWYGMNHVPWCAQFVSWAAWQAGVGTDVIPKHAYTPAGAAWFKARGQLVDGPPQAGDLGYVYYQSLGRIGHVFIVERVWRTDAGVLLMGTLEGNTNDTGSSQGNGVYRLIRADTTNLSYGRPAYKAGAIPPGGEGEGHPIDTEEQPMRYIKVVAGDPDPNVYGYTDDQWWIASDEEPASFGIPVRGVNDRQRDVIKSRVTAVARGRSAAPWSATETGPDGQQRPIARREIADGASRALQAWIGGGSNLEFPPAEVASIKAIGARAGVLGDLFTATQPEE